MGDGTTAGALVGEAYGDLLADLGSHFRLFASCGAKELSYEDTLGLKSGVFAHYLTDGLTGKADKNGDGVIQLSELAEYVETEVGGWCRANLPPAETQQHPARLPSGWTDDLPLAFTPMKAARDALARLTPLLSSSELQEASASLANDSDGPILAEWLLELDAGVQAHEAQGDPPAGSPERPNARTPERLTLDQYRTYRRTRREEPTTLPAQVYRLLPPEEALIAIAHLPATEEAARWNESQKAWHERVERLTRGELPVNGFVDWMDDWLRTKGTDDPHAVIVGVLSPWKDHYGSTAFH
jgi:hypothetical protein